MDIQILVNPIIKIFCRHTDFYEVSGGTNVSSNTRVIGKKSQKSQIVSPLTVDTILSFMCLHPKNQKKLTRNFWGTGGPIDKGDYCGPCQGYSIAYIPWILVRCIHQEYLRQIFLENMKMLSYGEKITFLIKRF